MNRQRIATLVWSGVLQWSRVGTNAAVFLLLSRWLSLEEIGAVAAVQAPVLILQGILTFTIPDFVVQSPGTDQRQRATMFWASLCIGAATMLLLCATAPLIVAGIDDPHAIYYLLILSLCPAIWSVAAVFEGLLRKELDTRVLGTRTIIASLISGVIAVTAGAMGAGAWAIVAFTTLNAFLGAALTVRLARWRPTKQFDLSYLRASAGQLSALAGRHMLAAATMPVLQYATVFQLGTAAGGALQIAARLFTLVDAIAITPLRFLILPLFARIRSDTGVTARIYDAVAAGSVIAAPAYFGLIAIAPSLLPLLIGSTNGTASADLVQILCVNGPLAILLGIVTQALSGQGHLRIVFFRSLVMTVIAVIPAAFVARYSVQAAVATYAIAGGIAGVTLGLIVAKRLLGANPIHLFLAWLRPLLAGATLLILPLAVGLVVAEPGPLALVLTIAVSPILYAIALMTIARPQLRAVLALVRSPNAKGQ